MNYYELLGIPETATIEEIKQAYKMQIKKWHPDINKSEEAINISIKLNEAKEILLDEKKRAEYDSFLKEQQNENYNKYFYNKKNRRQDNNNYEQKYGQERVTKWQYLYSWIKFGEVKKYRKILGVLCVLLESVLCYFIKIFLIVIAFICNFGSLVILLICNILSPFVGLAMLIFIIELLTKGLSRATFDDNIVFIIIIAYYVIYAISYILPNISNLILSPKVFEFLYNKIDINLFKKCVGYKE